MNIQLIKGDFTPTEAIDILTGMVNVKIKFHERKIAGTDSEEDIKMRERRIRQLQQSLHEARQLMLAKEKHCTLTADILIG
ncbi:hypothetical protein [Arsenicibacter rosenii]|uniref:Uncharacterized protein n=1 Tax=Arsenicibacter rosenii TaxID=1750698 RepID=A0A1S2VBE3_9BACT|nr:hypothetical protein [Arsenicibacter rosenii]OIN56051.1 hypothetical protein BLX24_26705 [Arsenicibacter rosenii]